MMYKSGFFSQGKGLYKEKQIFLWHLYYFALNKFIISQIIVTFKTRQ